jgi:hypothetical protein
MGWTDFGLRSAGLGGLVIGQLAVGLPGNWLDYTELALSCAGHWLN